MNKDPIPQIQKPSGWMGGLKPQSLSAICVQETDLFDGARADAVSRAPRLALRMQSTQSATCISKEPHKSRPTPSHTACNMSHHAMFGFHPARPHSLRDRWRKASVLDRLCPHELYIERLHQLMCVPTPPDELYNTCHEVIVKTQYLIYRPIKS